MKTKTVYFAGNDTFKMHVKPFFEGAKLKETQKKCRADIIYVTYGGHFGPVANLFYWLCGKSLVFHWIGSDVLRWNECIHSKNPLTRLYFRFWRSMLLAKHRRRQLVSMAVTEHLQDKLREIGIPATVFPITSINNETISLSRQLRKPDRPTDFISYIPFDQFDFYGGPLFIETAAILSHRKFLMVVPDRKTLDAGIESGFPPNVKVLPEVGFNEIQQLLADSKCLLRFTVHDGLSLMVLEALLAEMQVVWSRPFPHTHHINPAQLTPEKCSRLIDGLIANWQENTPGRQHVIEKYSVGSLQDTFNRIFSK